MIFDLQALAAVTSRTESEIKYLLRTVLDAPPANYISAGELLAVLVYDLLREMGYSPETSGGIIKQYKSDWLRLGKIYAAAKPEEKVGVSALQLLDNRYVMLMEKELAEKLFDFKALEQVERVPTPVLSLLIVLPELWRRAAAGLATLSDRRTPAAEQPLH